jgi:pyrimidine deaminase RibD-like protein
MPKLVINPDTVVISLSGLEKAEAFHADLTLPRSAVRSARAVPNGMDEVRGVRAPGTVVPGTLMVGTWRSADAVTFAACHGRKPALVLELADQVYDRVVIAVDDPQAAVAALG